MVGNESPTQHKRIYKVLLFTCDDPETKGTIQKGDAIEHEGKLWLVPLWLDSIGESWSMPARLICLSEPPAAVHLQGSGGFQGADYLLNYPIPIADLGNDDPPETDHGFVVIERPDLKIVRPH